MCLNLLTLFIATLGVPLGALALPECDFNAAIEVYRSLEKTDREVRGQYWDSLQAQRGEAKKRGETLTDAQMEELGAALRNVDKQNQTELEQLIAVCGWPTYDKWGATPVRAAFMVTQHAPLVFKQKYRRNIEEAFKRGDIRPHLYALFVDRVRLLEGKPQLYGTQMKLERDGTEKMRPMEDEAHVNDRRQALGMELHVGYPMPSNWPSSTPQAAQQVPSTNENPTPAATATK
jgi:hypothetical protein